MLTPISRDDLRRKTVVEEEEFSLVFHPGTENDKVYVGVLVPVDSELAGYLLATISAWTGHVLQQHMTSAQLAKRLHLTEVEVEAELAEGMKNITQMVDTASD